MMYEDSKKDADRSHVEPISNESKAVVWMTCPICERRFDFSMSSSKPFCSPRCKQVDLGRWLNESYGLPAEQDDGFDSSNQEE